MQIMDEKEPQVSNFWKELFKLILISVIIVIPFRLYIAQPFIVDGASMYPTFENKDYLIVDEISYKFREPERGSVIVFRYPKDVSKSFIKRLIGLPGETVTIEDGQVRITSNAYPEGLILEENYVKKPKLDNMSFTLAQDEYFVMGDNRAQSADSRLWGAVKREHIIGQPLLQFWPPELWPGDVRYFKTEVTN
jgi:signal peptidase I